MQNYFLAEVWITPCGKEPERTVMRRFTDLEQARAWVESRQLEPDAIGKAEINEIGARTERAHIVYEVE